MPALVLLGHRCRLGSDDLVIPGILESTLRAIWLALIIWLFIWHEINTELCINGWHLRMYLIGVMVILGSTLILTIVLTCHSMRGTIMHTAPRRHVPLLLLLRFMFKIPEIVWNVVGTVWIATGLVDCTGETTLPILMKAVVGYCWIVMICFTLGMLVLFDPLGKPSKHSNASESDPNYFMESSSTYIQVWERRCRVLCCCLNTKDRNNSEAFRNVADVLASIFEDNNLVASDIAAALVLLRLKRKQEEQEAQVQRQNINSSISVRALQLEGRLPFQQTPPPEWMKVGSAHHFMRFALGSYGWPWFIYRRFWGGLCSLWSGLKCCACCRALPPSILSDNCCMCHTAALKAVTNLEERNLIYVSFHNSIFQVPFYVAIDDETEHVIVAIRGTLSLQDAITDMTALAAPVEAEGLPEGSQAHKGMVQAAKFVMQRLEETRAIGVAMSSRSRYGLVVTGHSLGAGTAVVLSAMLRPQYPHLKCFAFSPPGGLVSQELASATQSFVMSVIVGDDLVPRLSMNSLYDLRNKIMCVLETCQKPKHEVLTQGLLSLCCKRSPNLGQDYAVESPSQNRPLLPTPGSSYTYTLHLPCECTVLNIEPMQVPARDGHVRKAKQNHLPVVCPQKPFNTAYEVRIATYGLTHSIHITSKISLLNSVVLLPPLRRVDCSCSTTSW
ncbi:diacylglycerol lipase-beta-like isoform X3 [Oratosquilla oratoria]|uniref:diacylglycerol lipase-beta-like isoform X3 n=1 Tax=Oratosquilla oratoria TaxID=337810 RepID=UPI003F771819